MISARFKQPIFVLIALLAWASQAVAANVTWIGNAHDVKQISTITVASTWLDTETATLTINGKDLVLTLVGNEATTAVATALKEMWMASTRLDGTASTDATSNAGGQQFGEFSEVTATVSGSVVTLTANRAGVPFTVTVAESSASGTLTLATPQAATGKMFWSNGDNWSGGSAPSSDDVVMLMQSDVPIRYGLPNGSLEVTFNHYMTYTGEVGLPVINITDPAKPYYEYRQRFVRLDDAGTGTNIAHRWGIGKTLSPNGGGSPLINVRHTTVKNSHVVYDTGKPLTSRLGTKALNIVSSTNTSTLNIVNGSVDWGSADSTTSAYVDIKQSGGDSVGFGGVHTSGALLKLVGGQMLIGQSGAIQEVQVHGGNLRAENQSGTIAVMHLHGGTYEHASSGTITNLNIYNKAIFDARFDAGDFTVTGAELYTEAGLKYLDPYGRTQAPSNFHINGPLSADLQFGNSIDDAMTVVP
jgi:hypothetical protein